jgi:uncharacterized protein YqeY
MNITDLKKEKLQARRDKNRTKIEAIDYVLASVETIELRNNKQLSDEEILGTIKKVVSELTETRDMYIGGQKHDDAKECEDKMGHLQEYLPAMLDVSETELAVDIAIEQICKQKKEALKKKDPDFDGDVIADMKDMGKVMGSIKKKFGATVDNALVSKIAKEKLS